jgi:hypothetical protein
VALQAGQGHHGAAADAHVSAPARYTGTGDQGAVVNKDVEQVQPSLAPEHRMTSRSWFVRVWPAKRSTKSHGAPASAAMPPRAVISLSGKPDSISVSRL